MEISLNSLGTKNIELPVVPPFLGEAERRAAARSDAARSGASPKKGGASPDAVPDPEVPPDARRRRFNTEYKLRVLAEADAAKQTPGAVGSLLRREGLYSSHLATWRRERDAAVRKALTPQRRGPKPKLNPQQAELTRLQRENERLSDELEKARLIIDVQKKVASLLGRELLRPGPGEKS